MLRLGALKSDAARTDAAGFAELHGRGFLIVHLHGDRSGPRGPSFRTRSIAPDGAVADQTGPLEIAVLPLRRRASSTNPFVCIGRLDGNDVCLPDDTVSKLHAIVRDEQGCLTIIDAHSWNGTWIDGAVVAARGDGEAVLLRSGRSIRFGSVSTSFLDADDLRELALRAG